MSKLFVFRALGVVAVAVCAASVQAAAVMPDFTNVPAGWTTDRYDPASFANVGTYQGRANVLGIGIDSTGNAANRGGQSASFYNTQGKQHAVSGGVGSSMSAGLYIDRTWSDQTNGNVRTDMWGVGSDNIGVTDYGIIGFTNYGGAARLRVYDGDTSNGWVDLATTITYNAWTDFEIDLTSTSLDYFVNGALVYSDATIGASQFSAVIMQAYNFADPAITGANLVDYVARWSNVPASTVPEPGSLALIGLGLAGIAAARRRKSV